jgi:hypothetical protein
MNRATAQRFADAELRLDKLFCLACHADLLALSDAAEEALTDVGQILKDTGISIPHDDFDEASEVAEALIQAGYCGFFVQFSQPVSTVWKGRLTRSWGYYTSRWFYDASLEEAINAALAWAAENLEKSRAELREPAAPADPVPTPVQDQPNKKEGPA